MTKVKPKLKNQIRYRLNHLNHLYRLGYEVLSKRMARVHNHKIEIMGPQQSNNQRFKKNLKLKNQKLKKLTPTKIEHL